VGNHVGLGDGGPEEGDVAATTLEHSLVPPGGAAGRERQCNAQWGEDGGFEPRGPGGTLGKRPAVGGRACERQHAGAPQQRHWEDRGRDRGRGRGREGEGGGGGFGAARSNSMTDLQRYATSAANERSYREALAEAVPAAAHKVSSAAQCSAGQLVVPVGEAEAAPPASG